MGRRGVGRAPRGGTVRRVPGGVSGWLAERSSAAPTKAAPKTKAAPTTKVALSTRSARAAWALEQAGVHPLLARLYAARGVRAKDELDDGLGRLPGLAGHVADGGADLLDGGRLPEGGRSGGRCRVSRA